MNGEDFERCEDRRETFMRAFLRAVLAHVYIAWIHPFGTATGEPRGWWSSGC
jgi:Fic family protein